MVEGTMGSHHKERSTKMGKHNTVCAGIDTGKRKLDIALSSGQRLQVDNNPRGPQRAVDMATQASTEARRHRSERWVRAGSGAQAAPGALCGGCVPAGAGARLRKVPPAAG